MIRMIEAGTDKEELARHADSLTKQASKQLAVLTYFIGGEQRFPRPNFAKDRFQFRDAENTS